MKRLLVGALLYMIALGTVTAQQRPQYTQYVQNNYLTNPAVSGIEPYADLRVGYRTQWVGLEGAPTSFYASLQGPIGSGGQSPKETKSARNGFSKRSSYKKPVPHHGVGFIAQQDKAGLLKTTSVNASYAYHQPLTKYIALASGISAGITQFGVNMQAADAHEAGDDYLDKTIQNMTKTDLTVGFWLYSPDFYIGVSGAQLLRNSKDFDERSTSKQPHLRQQPHFYGTAGLRITMNRDFAFIPSVMVKATESATPAIDVNGRVLYAQRIWGGVSYRHNDAMAAMAGANISHLIDVGYSYDFSTSGLNAVNAGSHEVVIGFKLNNRRKVICPTWMW